MHKNRRRVFLINPSFQLRLTLYSIISSLVVMGCVWLANYLFFLSFLQKGEEAGLPPGHIFFKFIEAQQITMSIIFVILLVMVTLFLAVFGILLSHKIAGPIYRINEDLGKLAEGEDIRSIQLRKGDYFQELADTINKVLETKIKRG